MNPVLVLLLVLSVAVFIYLGVALFKAEPGHGPTEVDVGLLHLDLIHYQATFKGRDLDLTAREFEFLAFLARHAGKVCTRRMVLENVWVLDTRTRSTT